MRDVIVFMLYVRPLNQMINPFNLATGLSLEVGPGSWPMVSPPPHKLELTHRTLYWKSWERKGWNCAAFMERLFAHPCCKNLF